MKLQAGKANPSQKGTPGIISLHKGPFFTESRWNPGFSKDMGYGIFSEWQWMNQKKHLRHGTFYSDRGLFIINKK